MEKNTPSRITTIRNTLINWRFPSTNSNSPSSFFGKMILAFLSLRYVLGPAK